MVDEKLVLLKNLKSQYEIIKNNYRKFSKEQLNELKNLRIEISNLRNNKNDYFLKDYNQIKKYIEEKNKKLNEIDEIEYLNWLKAV